MTDDPSPAPRIGLLYPAADPSSPENWSGTPHGLTNGLRALGVDVVPVGAHLPRSVRGGLRLLSQLGGDRGEEANRTAVRRRPREWALGRSVAGAGRLDGLLAMGTDVYDLARIRPPVPVVTYDDATLQQMWDHPDSEIRNSGFREERVREWIDLQRRSSRAADMCCVSTSWAGRAFVEGYGIPADRVTTVGMGHRPRRGGGHRDWSRPTFLFVGVDWVRKNGAAVVRAFEAVHADHPEAVLHLVGGHPTVDRPGVVGHGFLAREVPSQQAELDGLFATATAFVLPSRFDPSPIAYLEAASAGLPVVATTEGGAGELLGDAALTVHPDDHNGLVAAMRTLADPDTARTMGGHGAERTAHASWTHVAHRILRSVGIDTPERP